MEPVSGALTPTFSAPHLLTAVHILDSFSSGEPVLDDWLKKRALKNNDIDASRTFVVTLEQDVVAYFAMTVGEISHSAATGALRRNMPDPIPVTVLARLAVHENWHGHGLGRSLLREAVVRSLQVSANAAIKAIVVHALHERARGFYEGFGFQRSRLDEMTLMAPLKGLSTALGLQN